MLLFGDRLNVSSQFFFAALCLLLLVFSSALLPAQESILSSYERNFIRASLAAKTGVLIDAATDERADEFIAELYEFALQFTLDNSLHLKEDPDMISLVAVAARGTCAAGSSASVKTLWELFNIYGDSHSRVEILGALSVLGKGDAELVSSLNGLLESYNSSFRRNISAGITPDYPVLSACISTLGILSDTSSFPVLFSAMTKGYPQSVTQETIKALENIQGNHKNFLVDVIQKNPYNEKVVAFRIGAYTEKLTASEKGEIAQAALEVSLENPNPAEASLRYDAVTVLTRLKWVPAASASIRNFYQVKADYTNGAASRERFLEAIACLGVMGTSEAAGALALQLGFYNSQTEKSGEYDEALVLALVNSLAELGDKAAFDYLLYISYLNYPDRIQLAAREALNRLKW